MVGGIWTELGFQAQSAVSAVNGGFLSGRIFFQAVSGVKLNRGLSVDAIMVIPVLPQ